MMPYAEFFGVKIAAGLFEESKPSTRAEAYQSSFGGSDHRDIAREAVRKSLVLLKNETPRCPSAMRVEFLC